MLPAALTFVCPAEQLVLFFLVSVAVQQLEATHTTQPLLCHVMSASPLPALSLELEDNPSFSLDLDALTAGLDWQPGGLGDLPAGDLGLGEQRWRQSSHATVLATCRPHQLAIGRAWIYCLG